MLSNFLPDPRIASGLDAPLCRGAQEHVAVSYCPTVPDQIHYGIDIL
jgi:hypothetical protein